MSTVARFLGGGRGDAAPGSYAFIQPWGLSITSNGVTVLAADIGGHGIRQLEPGGLVRRMAGTYCAGTGGDGGSALAAQLFSPISAVADAAGNIYLSEHGAGGRIRQVNSGTNIIHTIVPKSPYSSVFGPMALALDGGWLYCADYRNHRVVKYAVPVAVGATAATVPVAGNGSSGNGGDGGPAVDAQLMTPKGVAVRNGQVFIADSDGNRVRVVQADSTIATLASGLKAPTAVAVAPNGDVYVAEYAGNRITRLGKSPKWVLGACGGVTNGACAAQTVANPVISTDPALQAITAPTGVAISADGTVLYAASQQDAMVYALRL